MFDLDGRLYDQGWPHSYRRHGRGGFFVMERLLLPETEPVTLDEMKRHLRCQDDITTLDDDISALITTAREWAEDFTDRALLTQTWRLTADDAESLKLHRAPIISINEVNAIAKGGARTVIESSQYRIEEAASRWPRLIRTGPTHGLIEVEFVAGFNSAEVVPSRFKTAMKLYAEALFDHDQYTMEMLIKVAQDILKPERAGLQLS